MLHRAKLKTILALFACCLLVLTSCNDNPTVPAESGAETESNTQAFDPETDSPATEAGSETVPSAEETVPNTETAPSTVEPNPETETAPSTEEPNPETETSPSIEETSPETETAPSTEEPNPETETSSPAEGTNPETNPATAPESVPETSASTEETLPETEAHTHTYATEWSTDANHHWHAATCGHADEVKDKASHTFGAWEIVTPATCGATGERKRTCTICAYVESETLSILPHSFSDEWSTDANHHWHSATCEHTDEQSGYAEHDYNNSYVCRVCSYQHEHTYADTWTTDAAYHWHTTTCGHDGFTDGKAVHTLDDNYCCTGCGYVASPTEGLTYIPSEDGSSYLVSGRGSTTDPVLVIPNTYDGLSVTGIDVAAFYGCTDMAHVFLPGTVTYIGENAFDGCTALESIYIPNGLTEIKAKTFNGCAALEYMELPDRATLPSLHPQNNYCTL